MSLILNAIMGLTALGTGTVIADHYQKVAGPAVQPSQLEQKLAALEQKVAALRQKYCDNVLADAKATPRPMSPTNCVVDNDGKHVTLTFPIHPENESILALGMITRMFENSLCAPNMKDAFGEGWHVRALAANGSVIADCSKVAWTAPASPEPPATPLNIDLTIENVKRKYGISTAVVKVINRSGQTLSHIEGECVFFDKAGKALATSYVMVENVSAGEVAYDESSTTDADADTVSCRFVEAR